MKTIFNILFLLSIANNVKAQEPKLMLPIGHTGKLISADYYPDGKRILTAGDNTAKVWDAKSGKLLFSIEHGKRQIGLGISSAQISSDGKKIITTSGGDSVYKIWDAHDGKLLVENNTFKTVIESASLSTDGRLIAFVDFRDRKINIVDVISRKQERTLEIKDKFRLGILSPTGNKILTAPSSRGKTQLFDCKTGELLLEFEKAKESIESIALSGSGKKVATGYRDGHCNIWDAETGAILLECSANNKRILWVKFNANEDKIAITSADGYCRIWDIAKKSMLLEINTQRTPTDIFPIFYNSNYCSFSPNGKTILTAHEDGVTRIWDATTGKLMNVLSGHSKWQTGLSFHPDGTRFLTYNKENFVRIWDLKTGELLSNLKCHDSAILSASYSHTGSKILTSSLDNTVRIWDTETGNIQSSFNLENAKNCTVKFSPDDNFVLSADNGYDGNDVKPKIWDAKNGHLQIELNEAKEVIYASYSPDGHSILTLSSDTSGCKVWDVNSGALIASFNQKKEFSSAGFSKDGSKVITVSFIDSTIKTRDVKSGELFSTLKIKGSRWLDRSFISPNGNIAITSWHEENFLFHTTLWNINTGNSIHDFNQSNSNLYKVCFSNNSKKVLLFNLTENVTVYDIESQKQSPDLKGHTQQVYDGGFSPDGKLIITLSSDNSCKVWDAATSKLLYTFLPIDSVDYLIIDKDNHFDGTEAARKLLYFTCGSEIIELDQLKDQLWVPNLAERINRGETINTKTLKDLDICGLTPEVEQTASKEDAYLFNIHPRRGDLGQTVLYVNGIEAKRYSPGQLVKAGSYYKLLVKKQMIKNFLVPGKDNLVSVKAYTANNAISSRSLVINENNSNEATAPNLYAVMVGISEYKGKELTLKYAAKDATDLSGAIAAAAKKLLNSGSQEHVFMYNMTTAKERYQLPEKEAIRKVLEDIGRKAKANDILLIFFAGHGVMKMPASAKADAQKQFYLLAADATKATVAASVEDVGISTSELTDWIKPQNIRAQKRILILDACNSGQAIKDFVKIGSGNQEYMAARNDDREQQIKAIDKLNEKSGLFILSASASNQDAYEMGKYSQGLLTYALLKTLKQQPDILEDSKYLNVSRWFNAAEKMVNDISKETGARQEPQVVSNTNFNIGLVDDEVVRKIILPQEKPIFGSSLFYNSNESADGDNLELTKLVNRQLNEAALMGTDAWLSYAAGTNTPDAYTLSGRYEVREEGIIVKVSIKQGNTTRFRLEEKGEKSNLQKLAADIVSKAANWVRGKK